MITERERKLWELLDDIDTSIDCFKPVNNPFMRFICRKVKERFKYLSSDGYNLKEVLKTGILDEHHISNKRLSEFLKYNIGKAMSDVHGSEDYEQAVLIKELKEELGILEEKK